jgi:hypothetical protein
MKGTDTAVLAYRKTSCFEDVIESFVWKLTL